MMGKCRKKEGINCTLLMCLLCLINVTYLKSLPNNLTFVTAAYAYTLKYECDRNNPARCVRCTATVLGDFFQSSWMPGSMKMWQVGAINTAWSKLHFPDADKWVCRLICLLPTDLHLINIAVYNHTIIIANFRNQSR